MGRLAREHLPVTAETLADIAGEIRRDVLRVLSGLGESRRGHPGSSLSIIELVTALYFSELRVDPRNPAWNSRDRFVLSKGHGALAVYVALARRGFFDPAHLSSFRHVNALLQGHPDLTRTPGIDMTTGSLGNGVSAAVGMALSLRLVSRRDARVYVIAGDGELQEGLVWEAAMAASKYALDNLVVVVDCNGLQASGRLRDVMPLDPLDAKWRAFGWHVVQIEGHELDQVLDAFDEARATRGRPTAILARTIKGKGVPWMEDDNAWHQRAVPPFEGRGAAVARPRPADAESNHLMRAAVGDTLLALAREGYDVVTLTADTSAAFGLDAFRREFPDRCIEIGAAEQNLMAAAAGLASAGHRVFACTYATFASLRAAEQVRSFIAYPRLDVTIVAGLGGLSGGIEGATHIALEDLAVMRAIPGMLVLQPADAVQASEAMRTSAGRCGPAYIRLGRDATPLVAAGPRRCAVGVANVIAELGADVFLLTGGQVTLEVLAAARILAGEGIGATVIEFPCLKPLDEAVVMRAAATRRPLFTVEEHNIIGGLGSAVSELLASATPSLVIRLGVEDHFAESGTPDELRDKYGLSAARIAERVGRELARLTAPGCSASAS